MELVKKIRFTEVILPIFLLFIGIFHEFLSCAASVVMLVWLTYKFHKEKKICFFINITSLSIIGIVLFYGLTALWAVDTGMALVGFVKFLPVLLYLVVLMQEDNANGVNRAIPITAVFMTVVSAIGMQLPLFEDFFSVAGRLSGFFQYPNTFAIFVLVAELLVLAKEKLYIIDYAIIAVLIFGIFYSGSRTVFVLAAVANAILIFTLKSKKVKLVVGAVILGFLAVVVICTLFVDTAGPFGRFLTISSGESTFIGRLLYFRDALPVILKHPFGLGYMGYNYIQQSIQTGVYSVMFVHNDFLQLMLDIGWLPSLVFLTAIIKCVFAGQKPFYKRLILCVAAVHTCFDFNLQFVAFFMVLLTFTDYKEGKEFCLEKKPLFYVTKFAVMLVCLYFGVSLTLSYFGFYKTAFLLYPLDTRSQTQLLISEKNKDKAYEIADNIINRNEYVSVAYSAKAHRAYSKGDFKALMEYKKLIFEKAPFSYAEYEEYCYMLITGYKLYYEAGDISSANICMKEFKNTVSAVHTIENKLSSLGKKIKDQPQTVLPQDIEKIAEWEVVQ